VKTKESKQVERRGKNSTVEELVIKRTEAEHIG
jgi:hypothetical protein